MDFDINYLKDAKLKNPIAVAGLPGIALIGKIALEYLIQTLDAEKFAELYSDKLPAWAVRENGMVRNLKIEFYEAKVEDLERDLILLTSDAQASSSYGQYQLSGKIVEVLSDNKASTALTMAAFLEPGGEKAPVVGAATDRETSQKIEKHGVELLSSGRIVGMNGLLISLAAEKDIQGFCLLGTTKDKGKDPDAAKAVLTKFCEIFDIKMDLSNFEERFPELPKFKPPKIKMPTVSGGESEPSYIR